MKSARLTALPLMISLLAPLAGCGRSSYDGPPLVPAKGQVLMDGEPLSRANISLLPIGETKSPGSFAVSDDQGNFAVRTGSDGRGAPAGEYKATVSKWVQADGSPIPPDTESAVELDIRQIVAENFGNPDRTPLTVTIGDGGNESIVLEVQKAQ